MLACQVLSRMVRAVSAAVPCPGARAFLTADDPHAGRPARQVEQPGQFSHPRAVAGLTLGVVGGDLHVVGDLFDQHAGITGEGEPDRVLHPLGGEPVQELVEVPGTVNPNQHRLSGSGGADPGQLPERLAEHGDVRASVPGPQHDRQRFTSASGSVVDEHAQRVEPEPAFERGFRVLPVGVCGNEDGVQTDHQRILGTRITVGGGLACQPPREPARRRGCIDRLQHLKGIRRQQADQPLDGRVGSHPTVDGRLDPRERDISQAVPIQNEADRQIGHDLARIMTRGRFAPRRQHMRQTRSHPRHGRGPGE